MKVRICPYEKLAEILVKEETSADGTQETCRMLESVWQEEVGGLRLIRTIFMAEPGTISLKDRF